LPSINKGRDPSPKTPRIDVRRSFWVLLGSILKQDFDITGCVRSPATPPEQKV
jgi:hypothetical protein